MCLPSSVSTFIPRSTLFSSYFIITVGAFRGISNAFKPNIAETGIVKAGTSDVAVNTAKTATQSTTSEVAANTVRTASESAASRSVVDVAMETANAEGKEILKRITAEDVSFIKNLSGDISKWSPAMRNNVARIFGIKPSDIGNLSKNQFRTLIKAIHPDKGVSQLANDLSAILMLIR